ncbi:MAG: gas vesicle protein [Cyanobacteria bacterium RM1_2_2]|nr:gas vesicle protein [Cyanobacteria bacterium RM1_2_2]
MYTYAFVLNVAQPLDLPEGIWGSLELVCLNRLAALVEPNLSAAALHRSDRQLMQAVLSHDRVIQEVFQQTTVLPLRFGTYFTSRQGLLDHLRSHQAKYLNKLTSLQGKAEYVLKLVPTAFSEPTIAAEMPRQASALDKKQMDQKQENWQQQQQTELQSLLSLISEHYPETVRGEATEGIERIYLLSAQQQRPQLLAHLQKWQFRFHCWELSLGENLPPYHFV